MYLEEYLELLDELKFGKKLPDAVYVHKSVPLPAELHNLVEELRGWVGYYNVIKFYRSIAVVSFLYYPNFFIDGHPKLHKATNVHMSPFNVKTYKYANYDNPPILHRKELLLAPNDKLVKIFADLTAQEEAEGLYTDPSAIGNAKGWQKLLDEKGLYHDRHILKKKVT